MRDFVTSDDPVRVFQRYATLDALSNGRAKRSSSVAGPASSRSPCSATTSRDYEELFEEKVNLFAELRKERPGHLGRKRPPRDRWPLGLSTHRYR